MDTESEKGLDSSSLTALRKQYGYNELPEEKESVVLAYLKNFWGPLPWLMEVLIAVSFISHQQVEGTVIASLLVINSIISLYQQQSAKAALLALTKKLSSTARVKRDGQWQTVLTRELVPGDIIDVKTGDIVPADAEIIMGHGSLDLSTLTGESFPKEVTNHDTVYSGAVMQRGEAIGRVSAIGSQTAYGRTTQLLETSHPPTHMERIIFTVIKYSFLVNVVLVVIIVVFGITVHAPTSAITDFAIVLLLTSVPISFPAMFTVAQSYGALEMSKDSGHGVLVRRLAAVQECAMVNVFCSDKTGTLTQNALRLEQVVSYSDAGEAVLIAVATACCDMVNGDAIDKAILGYAQEKHITTPSFKNFVPFDFVSKQTRAEVTIDNAVLHAQMGLPRSVVDDSVNHNDTVQADVVRLGQQGLRVVAVVVQKDHGVKTCLGLLAFADPIKPDAPKIIQELSDLGVRVIMITGDGLVTASAIAQQLGLKGSVISASELKAHPEKATESAVIAEAYPEDKLTIIRALQKAGHTVGMTGDGVNDAPALRQAEVGIAVCNATDVAKQSASFILTHQGLGGVVKAVKLSREVYNRLRTWALNKIIKSIEVSLFTTVLFFITHSYILSPLLAVLLIFANDFVTISMATDRTVSDSRPAEWKIGHFTLGAFVVACIPFALLMAVYYVAVSAGYSLPVMRTIIYLAMILFGKANLYAIRAWPHAWDVRPSLTLVLATLFSILFAITISVGGFLILPIPIIAALAIIGCAIINFFLVDLIKNTTIVRRLFFRI